MTDVDIVIVGGGMAGASLGAHLAPHARVLIVEMEAAPGYHATGRSVAFWQESYGGPAIQPLTSASGPLLWNPDPVLSDRPFLTPRRTLHIGRADSAAARDAMLTAWGGSIAMTPVDPHNLVPGLRPDWTIGLFEPSCCDIDVTALHQAYLAQVRRGGGRIAGGAALRSARRDGGGWRIEAGGAAIACRILVNAAGAWADEVARLCGVAPIGIMPLRRTVVQLRVPGLPSPDLPLVMDLEGRFYFKPEGADRLWLTPHDETPSAPCDAAPEELAVAQAIDRFTQVVDWPVAAVERKWAGLRSFAPDRAPVYGYDAEAPGFFWFAGQGGFGIQTAPAAALLGEALIRDVTPAAAVAGIDAGLYSPRRFR
ncbi:MAG: FAD-binding oxidoreductase [Sphingobium sp.]|nr:FAD-binding oxidoreductase [Sphingobium sp.]